MITGASFNKWPGKVFFEANKHVLRPLVEISYFCHLIFLLCMFRAGFTSRTSAKQTLAIFFFEGADFGVSALSFSFFGFVLFYCSFFFSGCDFCLLFFSGLNSCPGRTPNELRTNFGLKFFFFFFFFFGVELFGFWSYKNTGITAC